MNIAYLILEHNSPNHMQRLINALSSSSSVFFIHLDKKSDIRRYRHLKGNNIIFTLKRIPVFWGDFSQVEASLILLQAAFSHEYHFDRLVLLSGADYPLHSPAFIEQFFLDHQDKEFMNLLPLSAETKGKSLSRITTYQARHGEQNPSAPQQRDYKAYFGELIPYGGSTWWAISHEAAKFILNFTATEKAIVDFFKNTVCPDETFFQTIIGNSQFKQQTMVNITYADWSEGKSSPAYITNKHLQLFSHHIRLDGGVKLLARKFSDDSADLVAQLAQQIAKRSNA